MPGVDTGYGASRGEMASSNSTHRVNRHYSTPHKFIAGVTLKGKVHADKSRRNEREY